MVSRKKLSRCYVPRVPLPPSVRTHETFAFLYQQPSLVTPSRDEKLLLVTVITRRWELRGTSSVYYNFVSWIWGTSYVFYILRTYVFIRKVLILCFSRISYSFEKNIRIYPKHLALAVYFFRILYSFENFEIFTFVKNEKLWRGHIALNMLLISQCQFFSLNACKMREITCEKWWTIFTKLYVSVVQDQPRQTVVIKLENLVTHKSK